MQTRRPLPSWHPRPDAILPENRLPGESPPVTGDDRAKHTITAGIRFPIPLNSFTLVQPVLHITAPREQGVLCQGMEHHLEQGTKKPFHGQQEYAQQHIGHLAEGGTGQTPFQLLSL